jgi:UDP-N-acetylmuramoyl-L-alanyl-D-glutamate--2,6-diaminopimelate ligase
MRLKDLGKNLVPSGVDDDLLVFGVAEDSRKVCYGYVFFARSGSISNGLAHIEQAVANGAQAIVVPEDTPSKLIGLGDYDRTKIVVIRAADVASLYARTIARFQPIVPDHIAAVTGSNGKTSTVSFLRDIWTAAGHSAMSLGTQGVRSTGRSHNDIERTRTTHDPASLFSILGELVRSHQITHLAMEASSHALDQRRADGLCFEAAGFTNLATNHVDYHGSVESYFVAKLRLFTDLLHNDGTAVVNVGDPFGQRVAQSVRDSGRKLLTFASAPIKADFVGMRRRSDGFGQVIEAELLGRKVEVRIPVAGPFQMENLMAAFGLATATGVDIDTMLKAAETLDVIPGRIEKVSVLKNGAAIFVDNANEASALERVLMSLRSEVETGGRLRVVFGCAGDRDPAKRPLMGRVAANCADVVYVADDNPRTEDAGAIRAEILKAIWSASREGAPIQDAFDAGARRDAVERAITELDPRDILLITGKGHEDYHVLWESSPDGTKVNRKVRYSDREKVREVVAERCL